MPSLGPFRISKGADISKSCWVPASTGPPPSGCVWVQLGVCSAESLCQQDCSMDCTGRGWSPVTGPFQHLQSDLVWWAYLQGLPDHSQDGLELNHRPLKDPKPGLRSVRLLPEVCVSVTPAGSLGVWCC